MNTSIEVTNLSKSFFSRPVIKNISFSVEKNTIHGFLGPNGAGKSTTMKMLAGLLMSDAGTIKIEGLTQQDDLTSYKRSIGILPENPPLYDDMRVEEYLIFVGEIYGLKHKTILNNLEQLVTELGLQSVLRQLIGQLSKGFKQKVGIAQALMSDPSVIILDEPTIGLDPNAVVELRDFLKRLSKTKTILFSSHQLHEVTQLCQKVTLIHHGELYYSGELAQVMGQIETGHKYTLILDANPESAIAILDKMPNVSQISSFHHSVEFHLSGGDDESRELLKKLFENGIPVLEYKRSALALEETFLHLSHRNGQRFN